MREILRRETQSSDGTRILMLMFGPLLDSLFLIGPLFLGSFVTICLVLFLLTGAPCSLAPFCGLLFS